MTILLFFSCLSREELDEIVSLSISFLYEGHPESNLCRDSVRLHRSVKFYFMK